MKKQVKCLDCGAEFDGEIHKDDLGIHCTCPICESTFDAVEYELEDITEYL